MNTQLIGLVVAVLVAAVPLVRVVIQHKVTPDQMAHVQDIARVAVRGAEQLGNDLKGLVESSGAAKLSLATSVVVSGAKRLGVKLTADEATAFVTAALREMEAVVAA